jgi:uncharacterized protein DUF4410
MKKKHIIINIIIMLSLIMVVGCAKTKVTDRHELVTGQITRPGQIWVYNFAATPDEIPDNSAITKHYSVKTATQTKEQLATDQKLGAEIATELVNQIHSMGMPAGFGNKDTIPQVNDLVIRGYLISFVKGDATKRVLVGFGSGASDLKAAVEGFQMTDNGLRKLGYGSEDASGGKSPGADLGVIGLIATKNPAGLIIGGAANIYGEESGKSNVTGRAKQFADSIAKQLKERFQEQGWIN